jgi:beta-phosphoglucomutase-like phosphatase (HAD superfamily)
MIARQKLINGESIFEPNMRYDVVFFDFDGTLVDSVSAKRQAFFDLFPNTEGHARVVQMVLEADPDGSRYLVIPRMVEEMRRIDLMVPEDGNSDRLTRQYARNVMDAVCCAPEMPGAKHLLETLHSRNTALYLLKLSCHCLKQNTGTAIFRILSGIQQ